MSLNEEPLVRAIHDFWFGPLDAVGRPSADKVKTWFSKDETFDKLVHKRFLEFIDAAYMGAFDRWTLHDDGLVALIVLLDQFSRNMFRGKAKAFAYDKKAIPLAYLALQDERYLQMPAVHAYFALMPTMHYEDLGVQETGVAAFTKLLANVGTEHKDLIGNALRFAQAHRDIIARFGRFPHRNAAVERESTPEELAFLQEPGSSF